MIWIPIIFAVGGVVGFLTESPEAAFFATIAAYLLPFAIEGGRIE